VCSMIMNMSTLTAIAGRDFATFSMRPMKQNEKESAFSIYHRRMEWKTYRRPQSSHSNTGFQPSLLLHKSHFPINNPLEKNISNGFQPVAAETAVGSGLSALPRPIGDTDPLSRLGFPGFNKVNRWTRGAM
jgi:hypothetical protein